MAISTENPLVLALVVLLILCAVVWLVTRLR